MVRATGLGRKRKVTDVAGKALARGHTFDDLIVRLSRRNKRGARHVIRASGSTFDDMDLEMKVRLSKDTEGRLQDHTGMETTRGASFLPNTVGIWFTVCNNVNNP